MSTYGEAYDQNLDDDRISRQHETIRDYMLGAGGYSWYSLAELHLFLGYPEASISAQLRHLRKARFGAYRVEKRRREGSPGTWEYQVRMPLPAEPQQLTWRDAFGAMPIKPGEEMPEDAIRRLRDGG